MYAAIIELDIKKWVFRLVMLIMVVFFGFLILKGTGLFRKTEILETNFQTTNLQQVKMVTVLSKDGIRAIKTPIFETVSERIEEMRDNEQVIRVSINGDHRAYPINILSVHEIVDDVVGGVPVAVTWYPSATRASCTPVR